MIRKSDILDSIRIAAPCHVPWEGMTGGDQVRHCGDCRLNVYNLSEMERDEAIRLLRENEGRICVRLYRRADGTVITRDCPRGLRRLRRKAALAVVSCGGLIVSGLAFAMFCAKPQGSSPWTNIAIHDRAWRAKLPRVVQSILNTVDPLPPQPPVLVAAQTLQVDMGLP